MPTATLEPRPEVSPAILRVEIASVSTVDRALDLLDHAERYATDPTVENRAALLACAGQVDLGLAACLVARAMR